MAKTIGSIAVSIVANVQRFVGGMRKAGAAQKKFQKQTKSTGISLGKLAGIFAGFSTVSFVKSQLAVTDSLAKTATALGITTESLAGLQLQAELSGGTIQGFNVGMTRMARSISEAVEGTGEAIDAFRDLGVDIQKLNRLPLDEQLFRIADAMVKVEKQTDKVRFVFDIFGRGAIPFINIMEGGSEAIRGAQQEAIQLGLALDGIQVKRIEEVNDAFTRMKGLMRGVANIFLDELSPGAEKVSANILTTLKNLKELFLSIKIGFLSIGAGIAIVISKSIDGIQKILDLIQRSLSFVIPGLEKSTVPGAKAARADALRAIRAVQAAKQQLLTSQTARPKRLPPGTQISGARGRVLDPNAVAQVQQRAAVGKFFFGLGQALGAGAAGLVPTRGAGPSTAAAQQGENAILLKGSQAAFQAIRRSQRQDQAQQVAKKQLNEAKKSNGLLTRIADSLGELGTFSFAGDSE